MKYLLYLLLAFSTTKLSAQTNPLYLLESTVGQTEPTTIAFLRGVLKGKEPVAQDTQGVRMYALENVDVHFEYMIRKDSCVLSAAHFKTATLFNKYYVEVMESTKDLNGTRFKKLNNGQIVFYDLDASKQTIIAMTYDYVMTAE